MADKFIPLSVPNLSGNECDYVTNAVRSEWVSTAGTYVTDFENTVASYVHSARGVACQSGTAGLHISLLLSGVTNADIVLVPCLTFIAAVNPVKYLGAQPVFMDCDDSLCMDPVKVERFCEEECVFDGEHLKYKANGKIVRAMVVVHVFGNMADMVALTRIAGKYNIRLVEDATEALGTHYTDGRFDNAFAGTMGDIGVYSFNGNKIITTGGGGMMVGNNTEMLDHAKHLTTQAKSDPANFKHDEIGYNYRLTNLQAALGLAQMEQLESFIETKTRNYKRYCELVKDIPGMRILPFSGGIRSNYWFYSLFIEDGCGIDRDGLIRGLAKRNIQTRPIWGLICDQVPYRGEIVYSDEKARYYESHVVNVPCSTNLSSDDVETVVESVRSCLKNYAD